MKILVLVFCLIAYNANSHAMDGSAWVNMSRIEKKRFIIGYWGGAMNTCLEVYGAKTESGIACAKRYDDPENLEITILAIDKYYSTPENKRIHAIEMARIAEMSIRGIDPSNALLFARKTVQKR